MAYLLFMVYWIRFISCFPFFAHRLFGEIILFSLGQEFKHLCLLALGLTQRNAIRTRVRENIFCR